MNDQPLNDLWQGGPWEQPSPSFPAPPAVRIPAGGGRRRPLLRPKRRRRPRFLGLLALILALCILVVVLGQYFAPALTHSLDRFSPGFEDGWSEPAEYSKDPPSIPRVQTGSGVTLTILPAGEAPLELTQVYDQAILSLVSIEARAGSTASSGSGIVLTEDGYILTNAHVVGGAEAVWVMTYNNLRYAASLVGFNADEDLAVLKIQPEMPLAPAKFGDSNALRCGEAVSALGDPLGYRATFTNGIVSGLDREMTLDDGSDMVLLQTNAAINFGNSGGPLLNQYGQVVGINTIKIVAEDGSAEALGFAIPSVRVKYVADRLIAGRQVYTAVFGFVVSTEISPDGGLTLAEVRESSDAYAQGLRPGDRITSADGQPIVTAQDLTRLKLDLDPGDRVSLTYLRDGVEATVSVALMDADLIY